MHFDGDFPASQLTCDLLVKQSRHDESQVQREIHFQYRGGLIWLKVAVSGKSEPLNFLLDSGAGISAIDLQKARSLGVPLGNRQVVQGETPIPGFAGIGVSSKSQELKVQLQTRFEPCS